MAEPERPMNGEIHIISVGVARIEAKLDMLTSLGQDHEARIRHLEQTCAAGADHEPRLRAAEQILSANADHSTVISDLQAQMSRVWRLLWFAGGAGTVLGGGIGTVLGRLVA